MAASIEAKPRREVPLGVALALDVAAVGGDVTAACETLAVWCWSRPVSECVVDAWLWSEPALFALSDSLVVLVPPGASVVPD
jgi:hypothetical protein